MRTTLLLLLMSISIFLTAQSVSTFINEISYTASNPLERGFELAGQAGSNLDGWQMISYNLDGLEQTTIDLSGRIIPNQQNGYGTIWYDMDQGGNGGGLALVDASGTIQEFVAYGAITGSTLITGALDGIVSGLQPNYLGSTLPGISLQLIGSGTTGPTFQWIATQTPSTGGVNSGQLFLTYLAVNAANSNTIAAAPQSQDAGAATVSYSAFPNPVRSQLQVMIPASLPNDQRFLMLYNQNGQQVLRQSISNDQSQQRLDFQLLNAGAYYLIIQGQHSNWQETIIVK